MLLHGIWARGSKCVAAHKDKKGQRWAVPLWFLVLFIGVLNSCAPFFLLFHYLFIYFYFSYLFKWKTISSPKFKNYVCWNGLNFNYFVLVKNQSYDFVGCALPFTLIGSFFLRSTPLWHSWKWGTRAYHENTMKM